MPQSLQAQESALQQTCHLLTLPIYPLHALSRADILFFLHLCTSVEPPDPVTIPRCSTHHESNSGCIPPARSTVTQLFGPVASTDIAAIAHQCGTIFQGSSRPFGARHSLFMVTIDITTPRGFCATGTRLQRRIHLRKIAQPPLRTSTPSSNSLPSMPLL